jgi:crotonobetainyl-CoA:carnitine CoA-transferase CaiB-like acyl-CoA transferase
MTGAHDVMEAVKAANPVQAHAASTQPKSAALSHIRICDLTGLLAGAGATRFLAAFGAQVIRVEQPAHEKHRWDFLRGGMAPDGSPGGINFGGNFNNHNVEKLSITLDLKSARGKELLAKLIGVSDVVTENFSAHVMERLGYDYEWLRSINDQIIYVSNSGFGKSGPYSDFKSVGQVVQAVSGLTFVSGLPDQQPAGWGFAYMDHIGAYMMATAVLGAIVARNRTGQGQWIDFSCTEAGIGLAGPELLDSTVNNRPMRRPGKPNSNSDNFPPMVPHGIYPAAGTDNWVAIACRSDEDWARLAGVFGADWARDPSLAAFPARMARRDEIDGRIAEWTRGLERGQIEALVREAGVPVGQVARPQNRIENDPRTAAWGLWPTVQHDEIGEVRVEGVPVHLSATDWSISKGAPCLGNDNDFVYGSLLGLSDGEIADLRAQKVI